MKSIDVNGDMVTTPAAGVGIFSVRFALGYDRVSFGVGPLLCMALVSRP